jgi:hypothetical protein
MGLELDEEGEAMKRMAKLAALGALLAVTLPACGNDAGNEGPAAMAPVSAKQVQTIAENMLRGSRMTSLSDSCRGGVLGR